MRTFLKKRYPLLLVLFYSISSCQPPKNISDDFETPELSNIWITDRMVPEAFSIQSSIVRNGHSAAKITIHSGDVFEKGIGKSKDSERDELCEADKLMSEEGKLYEFQFSLFLPDSFPIVPTRLVIAQWKQYCGGKNICSDDSPVMAIRYVSGRLYITLQNDSSKNIVYQTTEEVRNKWLDFKFQVRFSRQRNGIVEGWLNEQPIIHFKGINCYSSNKGYGERNHFYFKMGLYRDIMTEPMSIYIDRYRKSVISE